MTTASVIIPAHNEASVIADCLLAIVGHDLEIVVVCNGCTDSTAEIARSFAGVQVVELDAASKSAALNAGDAVATAYPRVYLDADSVLPNADARRLVDAVEGDVPVLAGPDVVFNFRRAGALVKAFHRAFLRTPFMKTGTIGRGVYAMNAVGRAKFDEFPDLVGDDLFVYALFANERRILVANAHCELRVPNTLADLLRVRCRAYYGIQQMAVEQPKDVVDPSDPVASVKALVASSRSPRDVFDLVVYVGINVIAKLQAKRRMRSGVVIWDRDESSRV